MNETARRQELAIRKYRQALAFLKEGQRLIEHAARLREEARSITQELSS